MPGHDSEGLDDPAVRHRDPREPRHSDRTGDPGDDVDLEPGLDTGLDLLHPPAEHVRVAALEADDAPAGSGMLDQQPVDLVLRHRVAAGHLGRVDDQHTSVELVEERERRQSVGHHDVGLGQLGAAADGDQAGVTWSPTDEDDPSGPGPARRHRAPRVWPARSGRPARPAAM